MFPRHSAAYLLAFFVVLSLLLGAGPAWADSALLAPAHPTADWEVSRIDDVPLIYTVEPRAAAADSLGRLHIAYGGDHLYYAVCSGNSPASCSVETVDAQDFAGLNTALALDASGRPHIAYFAGSNGPYCDDEQIKYAYWTGTAWVIEVVEQACVGQHLALALDASGTPAITFFDDLWDTLQFAEREGPDLWNVFTLDGGLDTVGNVSALAYDSTGNLHVGYLGGGASYLGIWHKQRSGDTWETEEAVDNSGYFTTLDMAVDAAGVPHFAYQNQSTSQLMYATYAGSMWVHGPLYDMAYNRTPSLMIDTNGHLHIAFARDSDIGYTVNAGSGWSAPESVPAGGNNPLSLTKNPVTGQPNLAFYDAGQMQFTRRSASWSAAQAFDASGDTGLYVDMQVDAFGQPHVAYFDHHQGALRYGVFQGSAWALETVLSGVDVTGISLALDSAGNPHIAFEDYLAYDHTDLRYVYWDGLAWQERPALSAEGYSPSVALDSSDTPHVAYNDYYSYNNHVTLATWNGSGWDTRLVADGGRLPCLQLNQGGAAYISFLSGDYPTMVLNLAEETGPTSWSTNPIDQAEMINYPRLVMDGFGVLHALYEVRLSNPYTNWKPYYAVLTPGSGWQAEAVYSEYGESEARQISMVVDASGVPHIASQYDYTLFYSVRTPAGWTTDFWLDSNLVYELNLETGEYSAIGIDSDGEPIIAYYGEQDLKFARVSDSLPSPDEYLFFLPMARGE